MRLRTVAVVGLAAAVTGAAVLRRRRRAAPAPAQLGRGDGTLLHLAADDPRLAELRARAMDLRAALETAG